MIQRLLRGKIFYVGLTAFVLGLFYYGQATNLGSWLPSEPTGVAQQPLKIVHRDASGEPSRVGLPQIVHRADRPPNGLALAGFEDALGLDL